jgi:hypothetical protein
VEEMVIAYWAHAWRNATHWIINSGSSNLIEVVQIDWILAGRMIVALDTQSKTTRRTACVLFQPGLQTRAKNIKILGTIPKKVKRKPTCEKDDRKAIFSPYPFFPSILHNYPNSVINLQLLPMDNFSPYDSKPTDNCDVS